jgi:GR25 family glycosyltransferase involved in LPS biosynthesis
MIIDIREIPVYYINTELRKNRKDNIEKMLSDNGFKNFTRFNAVQNKDSTLGCAISHKKILDQIVKSGINTPFLVLEDDASMFDSFDPYVSIPSESDAIYLGLSEYARTWNNTTADVVAEKINEDIYRIYNMVSAHAILYINVDYVKFLSRAIQIAMEFNGHQDIVRASTMKFFNIYAQNKPIFFQNDSEMKTDVCTKVFLKNIKTSLPNASNLGFFCQCVKHA